MAPTETIILSVYTCIYKCDLIASEYPIKAVKNFPHHMTAFEHPWHSVWHHAQIATLTESRAAYGLVHDAAIATREDRIVWIGASDTMPADLFDSCPDKRDCEGHLVTPGLIDCHTHLVYGGNRAHEFEMRLNGASYEEIARSGGGILSTVFATRAASRDELYQSALSRVQEFLNEGITTIEIKSGYGLTTPDEAKMLSVARQLGAEQPVDVVTSFLGAHALPPEFEGRSDEYIELVCNEMLPAIAAENLADAVDAFCEGIGFSPAQVERVFEKAEQLGLPIKLHAEQLSDLKGSVMAANHGALSVDHLEFLAAGDVPRLADAGTVAVLLPGAFYCLRETKLPPIESLREQRVPIAIASDSNPGSSPVASPTLMMNMACTLFRLTPEEALAGYTRNAARALGLQNEIGTLEVGKRAHMVLWDVKSPAELSYRIGGNACLAVLYRGQHR